MAFLDKLRGDKDDVNPPPKNPTLPTSESERKIIAYVTRTHDDASRRRREQELQCALNCAFYEGNQWLRLDTASQQLKQINDPNDPLYYYTQNHFHRVLTIAAGLATQNQPDASPAPLTASEIDFLAAKEARPILGYTDRRFARDLETEDAVLWAFLGGCSWTMRYWNPTEPAEVMVGGEVKSLPVGNICGEVVPWFEVYVDADAIRYEDALYVDRKSTRSIEWLRKRFGAIAEEVSPDAHSADGGQFSSYASTYVQGYSDQRKNNRKDAVRVIERWERPSTKYANGRYIIVAGGRIMQEVKPNPFASRPGTNPFPLVRHAYKEAKGHPYGIDLGRMLIDSQRAHNAIRSKLIHRQETAKAYEVVSDMSEVSPKALDSNRELERIVYHGTVPPQIIPPPPLSGDSWEVLAILQSEMEDAAGARDIAQGKAPAGMPAAGIELLQRANSTQHGAHIKRIERRAAELGDLELFLFGQNAGGPISRLLGLDEDGNPTESGMAQATPLRHITNGGNCRVLVTPGSASPQDPAAQNMQIMELRAAGVLGPFPDVQSAASAQATVKLLRLSRTDKILEEVERMIQMLLLQMQQEQEQAIAAQEAQAQAQAAAQPRPEEQLAMMREQADMEAARMEQSASLDVQKEAAKATIRSMERPQVATPRGGNNGR